MLGTIMVANVFFVIIPAHWELVRAKEAGRDARPAAQPARQAALGAQQLLHAAGALRRCCRPLRVHVRAIGRVARARAADGDQRARPALLQPPPRAAEPLVDPGCRAAASLAGIAIWLRPPETSRPPAPRPRRHFARERHRRRALRRRATRAPDAARHRRRRRGDRVRRPAADRPRAADIKTQAVVPKRCRSAT